MTSDVLSWNDSSNNQYIVSGVGSYIINPISAYRTAQKANKKLADDIFVIEPPEGPGQADHGRRVRILRHLEIRQEQGSGDRVPQVLRRRTGRKPSRRARATTTRASPTSCRSRCRSCRTIRPRPRTTSWRSCRTSDKWSAIPGYPGPATPAMDEIYYSFIINDMMAKAATGPVERRRVGQVGHAAMRGHLEEVGRQGLIDMPGPRARARSGLSRRVRRSTQGADTNDAPPGNGGAGVLR